MYFNHADSICSQGGEDGIIEKLFEDLKITNGILVEFGAADGRMCSNTYRLWKYNNWDTVLIECNPKLLPALRLRTAAYSNVEIFEAAVSPHKGNKDSLDSLLSRSRFNINNESLALVSIDVDSFDYHIFDSMETYLPKVVLIETWRVGPPHVSATDIYYERIPTLPNDPTRIIGCSHYSVVQLAERKGYTFVCTTGNAFFVRNDLMYHLSDKTFNYEDLVLPFKVTEANAFEMGERVKRYRMSNPE